MLRFFFRAILVVSIAFAFEVSVSSPAEAQKITKSFNQGAFRNTTRQQIDLAKRTQQRNRARAVQRLNLAISRAQTRSRQAAETAKRDAAARAETIRRNADRKRRENANGVIISRLIARGGTIRSAASPYNAGPVPVQYRGPAQPRRDQLRTTVSRLSLAVARKMPKVTEQQPPKRRILSGDNSRSPSTVRLPVNKLEALKNSTVARQIRSTYYQPSGLMSGKAIGHTFSKHGSHNTKALTMEARSTGRPNGQWLNDRAAEKFISDNLGKLKNGAVTVKLPPGLGRIIMPNGSFEPAKYATLVPRKTGVRTAYPVHEEFISEGIVE